MTSKRVYITLPENLITRAEDYNSDHPQNPVSYSGLCRKALEEFLKLNKYFEEKTPDRVWTDCKHGRWLSPCPICAEENKMLTTVTTPDS